MDIETLISEIFIRSPLWDQKSKYHHNRFVLDKLWDEVAVKLNTTRAVVRSKWKSLRDKFRTILASSSKTKSGEAQIDDYKGEWKYFKSLLFLKDQFTQRKSSGNSPKEEENVLDVFIEMPQNESDSQHAVNDKNGKFPFEQSEDSDSTLFNIKPCISRAATSVETHSQKRSSNTDPVLQQIEKKKRLYLEQNDDEDLNFFKSLLPHVRTFSPYDKMEYRMKVLKITQAFLKPCESLSLKPCESLSLKPCESLSLKPCESLSLKDMMF
ncbi:hypothetical protein ABEB36_005736 [Hypothenemus hampei]|uniref:Transcription factor Adf-1 n=1 Tax=Hypothenemus hampei TaxID=57062 RepID=A0ABD1EZW5_HYPHA